MLGSSTVIKGCYQSFSTLNIPNGSIRTIAKHSSAYGAENSRAMGCIEPPYHERAQVFTRAAEWLHKQTPLALLHKASTVALHSFGHSSILLYQDTVSIYSNSIESYSLFNTKEGHDYSPLDPGSSEFRLLKLMPGLGDEEVRCILIHSSLDDNPSYEALSYLWGDQQNRTQILLGEVRFSVTSNLQAALRRLREPRRSRTLWVDALCINQSDNDEKTIQVQRMTRIYSQASGVIAWTGDSTDNSDEAVNIIKTLGRLLTHADLDEICQIEGENLLGRLDRVGFRTTEMPWDALWAFFERPYWSRVWVIQELAVRGIETWPCTFYCGASRFDMREYALTCGEMPEPLGSLFRRNSGHPPGVNMLQVISAFNRAITRADPPKIQFLLYVTRNYQATDERDKLYALLGLARNEDQIFLPDYSRPLRRTMMEFVKFLVERDKDLRYLEINMNRRATCSSVPSWTFEVHSQHHALDMWGVMMFDDQTWQASKGVDTDVQFDMETESMIATGVSIGNIGFVIGPMRDLEKLPPGSNPANFRQLVEDLGQGEFVSSLMEYTSSLYGDAFETFWRTLILDLDSDTPFGVSISPARDEVGARGRVFLRKEALPAGFLPDIPFHIRYKEYTRPFYEKAGRALSNRTFFTTENGFSGVGPYDTQPGDVAVVLYGSQRCTVLRPDGDFYRIVGDAYVYGAMRGEMVQGLDVDERVYVLR
ncbi:hypothetical protein V2G26_004585 [Clonostachys chloroleuca]